MEKNLESKIEQDKKRSELLKELEYINDVIKNLRPNDSEASFYYYQKNQIEEELEECGSND